MSDHGDYRKWIQDQVEEMRIEAPSDSEEAREFYIERIEETSNQSEWILNYSRNQEVIDFASAESRPDFEDVAAFHTAEKALDWREVRLTEATLTLQAELKTELERQNKSIWWEGLKRGTAEALAERGEQSGKL